MRQLTRVTGFALLTLLVGMGCMERSYFTSPYRNALKAELLIDGVESSPEKPVPLCGEEDLAQFISILTCANGQKVFPNLVAGLDQEDLSFNGTTQDGHTVHKFKAVCYMKEYELYITTEACDEVLQYNN